MRVEIRDREFLHVGKYVRPQISHGSLCDIDHDDTLGEGSKHTDPIEDGNPPDRTCQRTKIRVG